MSLHPSTMPGVLIDESEADDRTRALFHATRTPTRSEVIKSAEWLGCTVESLCANLELDFNSLPDDDAADPLDLTPLRAMAELDQPPLTTADRITYWVVVGICSAITVAALAGSAGYIWQRWFA